MTTQDYQILGKTEEIRSRRFKVMAFHLKGATPPEIAHALGISLKTACNDIEHIRKQKVNHLSLGILKDCGANFCEVKVRAFEGQVAKLYAAKLQNWAAIIGLEKQIFNYKMKSLEIQGVFSEIQDDDPKPIRIIFEEVDGRTGRQIGRRNTQDPQPADPEESEEYDDDDLLDEN